MVILLQGKDETRQTFQRGLSMMGIRMGILLFIVGFIAGAVFTLHLMGVV